jgi:glycosyltransferase involved in cell wall biosynthesis
MASGLPVIGANARALPEYIDTESGIIVPAGDYQALARAIIKILGSDSLRQSLSSGGQKSVLNYTPENIAAAWEGVYEDALQKKSDAYVQTQN